jgi:hypothetical protein
MIVVTNYKRDEGNLGVYIRKILIYMTCIFKCCNFFISVKYMCICREVHVAQMKEQDRQCPYNVTMRTVRTTIVAGEKTMSVAYSEFVSIASVIQHSKLMRHVILSSMAICCTLSHKWHYFREKVIEHRIVF